MYAYVVRHHSSIVNQGAAALLIWSQAPQVWASLHGDFWKSDQLTKLIRPLDEKRETISQNVRELTEESYTMAIATASFFTLSCKYDYDIDLSKSITVRAAPLRVDSKEKILKVIMISGDRFSRRQRNNFDAVDAPEWECRQLR